MTMEGTTLLERSECRSTIGCCWTAVVVLTAPLGVELVLASVGDSFSDEDPGDSGLVVVVVAVVVAMVVVVSGTRTPYRVHIDTVWISIGE